MKLKKTYSVVKFSPYTQEPIKTLGTYDHEVAARSEADHANRIDSFYTSRVVENVPPLLQVLFNCTEISEVLNWVDCNTRHPDVNYRLVWLWYEKALDRHNKTTALHEAHEKAFDEMLQMVGQLDVEVDE